MAKHLFYREGVRASTGSQSGRPLSLRPIYLHWDWELEQGTGPGETNREEGWKKEGRPWLGGSAGALSHTPKR